MKTSLPALVSDQVIQTREDFLEWLATPRTGPQVVWYLNPLTLVHLRKGNFEASTEDRIVADGRLMARSIRTAGKTPCESVHFDYSGMAGLVFDHVRDNGLRIGFVGGNEREANRFAEIIKERHPGIEIAFASHGYFSVEKAGAKVKDITDAKLDVILISTGSPRQERFAALLRETLTTPTAIITCGGFLSQTVDKGEAYYPDFIVRMNIRFVYRLLNEPKMHMRILRYYVPYLLRLKLKGPDVPFVDLQD